MGASWPFLIPQRDQFDWTFPDMQIGVARANEMTMHGQSIIYNRLLPDWLKNGFFSREELIDIMKTNIRTIMQHYSGVVSSWVVVNEAGVTPPQSEKDFFYQKIGPDYIDLAFEAAREADSSAILVYNDFPNHTVDSYKYRVTKEIVDRLFGRGLVDEVGIQCHFDGAKPPQKSALIEGLKSYGIPARVTEFDINIKDVPGTQEERFAIQAKIARDTMEAVMEASVRNFTTWGIGDKYSWLQKPEFASAGSAPNANPTLFDVNEDGVLVPKPAYFEILDTMVVYASTPR